MFKLLNCFAIELYNKCDHVDFERMFKVMPVPESRGQNICKIHFFFVSQDATFSLKTCPCKVCPIEPDYSKTKICRCIPIFLIFAPKHRLWVLVRTASAENFQFLKLKKSLYIAWASFRNEWYQVTITYLNNVCPLLPHFYVVKLGYIFFLF